MLDDGTTTGTPLFYAAAQNHVHCCALLLDFRSDLLDLVDSLGDTALHVASYYGHATVLRLLLESAANPHVQNAKGFTPAHVASTPECLELLFRFDAVWETPDLLGRTALFCASAATGREQCVEFLCATVPGATALVEAADQPARPPHRTQTRA